MPFVNLEGVEWREVLPGCRARFVHGERMTLSFWDLDPGAVIPRHAHPHEQVSMIIEGEMEMAMAGETRRLTPGKVAVIPPNTDHAVHALTRCRVIDAFAPVREDYR